MEISQKNVTDETILRMRKALGVDSDLALSKKLGKDSRGYVYNWRTNNKVPADAVETVSQLSGKPFEEIRHGHPPTVNEKPWLTPEQADLLDAYQAASDEIKEAAFNMLRESARKSRENERGGSDLADQNSA